MADETDEIWKELRLIVFFYVCLTALYAVFLFFVYGQEPSQDWPELLNGLADIFFGKKANILATAIYVVLTTLPLAISSFLVMVIMNREELSNRHWLIGGAIILPFFAYFTLIDRTAVAQMLGSIEDYMPCHQVFENGRFQQKCSSGSYSVAMTTLMALIWGICKFYFIKYKFPLALGSLVLGGWAGYRVEKQLGKW